MHWDHLNQLNPSAHSEDHKTQSAREEVRLVKLLGARLLLLAQRRKLLDSHIDWQPVFDWLGIDEDLDPVLHSDLSPREKMRLRRQMQSRQPGMHPEAIEKIQNWLENQNPGQGEIQTPLLQISQLLARRMDLSAGETRFLFFLWLKLRHNSLSDAIKEIRLDSLAQASQLLEVGLGLKHGSLKGLAFDKHPLRRFNILRQGMHSRDLQDALDVSEFLELLNNVMTTEADQPVPIDQLEAELDEASELLCPRFKGDPLGAEHFAYVPQLQLVKDYLKSALQHHKKGCNVLFYGRPGVGKTLLAGSLADWLGADLYEVPFDDQHKEILPRHLRMDRMTQGQQLLSNKPDTLMLFDEMEDAFGHWRQQPGKAWLNRHLENNPLPTIWLCNELDQVDPAYLRRFDLVLEVPVPTSETLQQRRLAQLGDLAVTPAFREWLAQADWATPAHLDQLKRLAQHLPGNQPLKTERKLLQLLEQRLEAEQKPLPKDWYQPEAGHTCQKKSETPYQLPDYSEVWLNTDPGLDRVVRQIRRVGNARLCLHGHPGTGKTAFAQYLAEQLKRPLIKKSASSLLGMFVGQTEKAVAGMFAEAKKKKAVLLLDEAETFLQSRVKADLKGWEVSMVNEMLVQLETFEGIFIATSNRFEQLDTAMMRRFDLKVAFDWLKPQQLRSLLAEIFQDRPREMEALQELRFTRLAHLQVSPGNLQTALRRLNLQGRPLRLNSLLDALLDEDTAQQKDKSQPIGFIHPQQPAPVQKQNLRPAAHSARSDASG